MSKRKLTLQHLMLFCEHLGRDEKSVATIEKYLRDTKMLQEYAEGHEITKEIIVMFKKELQKKGYAVRSINSMLASLNSLFSFLGWDDCKVKMLKIQQQIYCAEDKELTKAEYYRLLEASKKQVQLNLVIQTICATGIRVSELKYFTVEAVFCGEIVVRCKNKTRTILVPGELKRLLLNYTKCHNIKRGIIFITKKGSPLGRSNIWTQMKRLCAVAGVNPSKVFPHNLRKLFARTFYGIEKDIAKLADILGHSNINTTRIYIMETGVEHRRRIEQLGLVV